jgi:hypothetical protein
VLVTDGPTIALDDVYVSAVNAGGSNDSCMSFTLEAKEVRIS